MNRDARPELERLLHERAAKDVRAAVRAASVCARRAAAALDNREQAMKPLTLAEAWADGQDAGGELFAAACRTSASAEAAFVGEAFHAACVLRAAAGVVWMASAAARKQDAKAILRHLDTALDAAVKALAVEGAARASAPAHVGGVPVLFDDVAVDEGALGEASAKLLELLRSGAD